MAYEVVMLYHFHMPSCFLGTFTEYPHFGKSGIKPCYGLPIKDETISFFSTKETASSFIFIFRETGINPPVLKNFHIPFPLVPQRIRLRRHKAPFRPSLLP